MGTNLVVFFCVCSVCACVCVCVCVVCVVCAVCAVCVCVCVRLSVCVTRRWTPASVLVLPVSLVCAEAAKFCLDKGGESNNRWHL